MPQLMPLSHPVPAVRSSREVLLAIFLSVVIHLFPALILWIMATNRIAVEPAAPSIGKTLMVSLTTLPDTTHKELETEEVTVIPVTDSPFKHSQTDPKGTKSVEHKPEAEIFVTPKAQAIPVSDTPEGYSLITDTTPLFKLEARYRMDWDFEKIPELKAEGIETSINQGVSVSGIPGKKSLAASLTPSYGLDAVYRFEQVFGEMAEAGIERKRIEWRIDYIKKYEASLPPDCAMYYGSGGLLAIPVIIKDVITHNNKVCMW